MYMVEFHSLTAESINIEIWRLHLSDMILILLKIMILFLLKIDLLAHVNINILLRKIQNVFYIYTVFSQRIKS